MKIPHQNKEYRKITRKLMKSLTAINPKMATFRILFKLIVTESKILKISAIIFKRNNFLFIYWTLKLSMSNLILVRKKKTRISDTCFWIWTEKVIFITYDLKSNFASVVISSIKFWCVRIIIMLYIKKSANKFTIWVIASSVFSQITYQSCSIIIAAV